MNDQSQVPLLCLLGAPGAGKGTQGALLAAHLGGVHVSVGELVRARIAEGARIPRDRKTRLVETQYTVEMILAAVAAYPSPRLIVLDGFPRDSTQVEVLGALPWQCRSVIWLAVDLDTAIVRMVGRSRAGEDIARIGMRHLNHDYSSDALRSALVGAGIQVHDIDACAEVERVQRACREVTHNLCG